ncbi:MAG: orotidine-5'-phosphate decarboxylase [Phycisphaerales bacterium]|nr:orotidine-5'-phosphate decarboxylase [Phycisphaerales bacterium]MCB9841165.1 orotidine-5'-phosphate decarboxylase [Phycisphaeraceae bacterium]
MPNSNAAHLHRALSCSPACVGLDPVLEKLPEALRGEHWEPARAIEHFCRGVLDAVAPHVRIIKPQSACFERYGSAGWLALEHTVRHARDLGLLVILDAKRGDIGVSAEHYAAAAAGLGAHAITVSPYLGAETIEPYLDAGLVVFVLVRTSNPGGDGVQAPVLGDGRSVAGMVAEMVRDLGASRTRSGTDGSAGVNPVGAVVGATKAREGVALRGLMPDTVFLVPGYGAQGGTLEDVRGLIRPGATGAGDGSVIVNSSRGVLYPGTPDPARWSGGVGAAAARLAGDLRDLFARR